MPVNLRVTIGTVNYTDYLHVTASKVSSPGVIAWQTWLDVPVTNYNLIIPGLDPEVYYVRFYDSPDDSSLGTLVSELLVNALTGETLFERRFYTVDGAGPGDPGDGESVIQDDYLIGKTVTGVFKEGFRHYIPDVEYTFDIDLGEIEVINSVVFSSGEVVTVELKYNSGVQPGGGGGGLYSGTVDVTETTRTLLTDDLEKRVRLLGAASTQVVTLPLLSGFVAEKGFFFDNTVGGVPVQVKLIFSGTDKVKYNGFNAIDESTPTLFSEFWVSRGETLRLQKLDDDYWEVIGEYKGTNVGERFDAGFGKHPNTIPEDGRILDAADYPRLWWWINNILPANHKFTYDVDLAYTGIHAVVNNFRRGQFCIDTSGTKFRMPWTTNLVSKGLSNFTSFGSDPNRSVDYPGGVQPAQVGEISITIKKGDGYTGSVATPGRFAPGQSSNPQQDDVLVVNENKENTVVNNGVIFLRRI